MYTISKDTAKSCLKALGKFKIVRKASTILGTNASLNMYSFCFDCSKINKDKNEIYELFKFNMIRNTKLITITKFSTTPNDLIENREDFEQMFSIFVDYVSEDVDMVFFQSRDSRVVDTLLEKEFEKIKIRKIPNTKFDNQTFSFCGTKIQSN